MACSVLGAKEEAENKMGNTPVLKELMLNMAGGRGQMVK